MCALKTDFPQLWCTWIILARIAPDSFSAGLGGSLEGESGQKWSDGSVVESMCCSWRRTGFSSQCPTGQLVTVTPILEERIHSSDLCEHMHTLQAKHSYA